MNRWERNANFTKTKKKTNKNNKTNRKQLKCISSGSYHCTGEKQILHAFNGKVEKTTTI